MSPQVESSDGLGASKADIEGKTVTVSFRLSAEVYRALQKHARETNQTLNSLVNHVLRADIEWGVYQRKMGVLSIANPVYKILLENVSDGVLADAGSEMASYYAKTFITAKYGELNLANVVAFLKNQSTYTKNWRYGEASHGGTTTIVLNHDTGRKRGIMLSQYVKNLFGYIGLEPRISVTDAQVTIDL